MPIQDPLTRELQMLDSMPKRQQPQRTQRDEYVPPKSWLGRFDFVMNGSDLEQIKADIHTTCADFYGDADYAITLITITQTTDTDAVYVANVTTVFNP